MDDAMKIRDLNFKVTCLQNGLRIEKGQANVAYKENQLLKIEVDLLKTKLQNANEDKLATISAERKRWAREDFNALAIRDLEQQARGIEDLILEETSVGRLHSGDKRSFIFCQNAKIRILNLQNYAKALKDQGNG
jgi:hypothetical protein